MIIDQIPKSGILQKGQCFSLQFFQKQIANNLSNISRRIRDICDYQAKKKGPKRIILTQKQYLRKLYYCYSLDYASGIDDKNQVKNENQLPIIDDHFIAQYPLFYQPKWRIFFAGQPSIRNLAILNHLAYGYFYQKDKDLEIKHIVIEFEKQNRKIYMLRGQLEIQIGTIKLLNKSKGCFNYYQYISYDPSKQLNSDKNKKIDPRKIFNLKQLHQINIQTSTHIQNHNDKVKQKKCRQIFMTKTKLKQNAQVMVDAYHCNKYQGRKANQKQINQFQFKMQCLKIAKSTNQFNNHQKLKKQQILSEETQIVYSLKENVHNFLSAAKIVNFLEKIPNFAYHLSLQERQAIDQKGNVIVKGRSGTGKTTCALLRLFSLQLGLKIKMIGTKYFRSKDIDTGSIMKNVFLTCSPYLIEQLKKNYAEHIANVKYQLQKKQQQKDDNERQIIIKSVVSENISDLRQLDNRIYMRKTDSLNNLTKFDFPGFFTLKNFLIMLDATFDTSFFVRNVRKNIDKQTEIEIVFTRKQKFWIKGGNGKIYETQQINYQYFRDIFWVTEKAKRKQLKHRTNSMTAWTEIFSIIKGSVESHKCPNLCISQQMYIHQSKNKFLNDQQKKQIYFIFKLYREWKNLLNKFDLMDVVNYLLSQISKKTYTGPLINNIYIDQVQDMTPAAIYLVSQLASNNMFYAGDTAQSISKGVIFKFSDIKMMYRDDSNTKIQDKKQPNIMQLTINFRSQNSILRVANTLVRVMELLFPKTIDSLKKQTSNNKGPKPVMVQNIDQIKQILSTGSSSQKLNSKQAIIVRNHVVKQQVMKQFKNALILTIQQCKGLEFDDVVIWKFIEDSKTQQLWKILDFLEVQLSEKCNQKDDQDQQKEDEQKVDKIHTQMIAQVDDIDTRLTKSKKINEIYIKDYQQISTELKFLYTAVTRAKQNLLFFNSLPTKLIIVLQQLKFITKYTKQYKQQILKRQKKKQLKFIGESSQRNAVDQQWRKSGVKFYMRQDYAQALVCFRNIGETKICHQLQGKIKVKQAQKLMQRFNVKNQLLEQKQKTQRDIQEMKELQNHIKMTFLQAAKIYGKIDLNQEAGKACYLAKSYKKAIKYFSKVNMFTQMAMCHTQLKQYSRAGEMYEKALKYDKVVESLMKGHKFISALIKLSEYRQIISDYNVKKANLKIKNLKRLEKQILAQLQASKKKYKQKKQKQIQMKMRNELQEESQPQQSIQQQQQQIQQQQKKQYQQQQQEFQQLERGRLLRNINNIKQSTIQKLNITIFIDKNSKSMSFQQFLQMPINIQNLLQQLKNYHHYQLAYIMGTIYEHYQNFQDCFVACLADRVKWQIGVDNFYKFSENKKEKIIQRSVNQEAKEVQKIMGIINMDELKDVQQCKRRGIMQDFRQNLVLSGFYQIAQQLFKNPIHFYRVFMHQQNFLRELVNQKFYQHFNKQLKFAFLKNDRWHQRLSQKQLINISQIILHTFNDRILNKETPYNKKVIYSTVQQQKNVQKTISLKIWQLNKQKQSNLTLKSEQQQKYDQFNKQKQPQVDILNKQILKIREKIFQNEKKSSAINKRQYSIKQNFKKLRKQIDNQKLKQQKFSYAQYKEITPQEQKIIKQKLDQIIKFGLKKAKYISSIKYPFQQQIIEDKREKYEYEETLYFNVSKIQNDFQQNISNLNKKNNEIETKIQKYKKGKIYYNQLLQKQLDLKIKQQTKSHFIAHKLCTYYPKIFKNIYLGESIQYHQYNKIINFNIKQKQISTNIQISLFSMYLLFGPQNRYYRTILDNFTGFKNTLRMIKRNHNRYQRYNNYQQAEQNLSDHQSDNQQQFNKINQQTSDKINQNIKIIIQFYQKILYILAKPQVNLAIHLSILKYFNATCFEYESQQSNEYKFMKNYSIIKRTKLQQMKILNNSHYNREIRNKFSFFDTKLEYLVIQKQQLINILFQHIKDKFYNKFYTYLNRKEDIIKQIEQKYGFSNANNNNIENNTTEFDYSVQLLKNEKKLKNQLINCQQKLNKNKKQLLFGRKIKAQQMNQYQQQQNHDEIIFINDKKQLYNKFIQIKKNKLNLNRVQFDLRRIEKDKQLERQKRRQQLIQLQKQQQRRIKERELERLRQQQQLRQLRQKQRQKERKQLQMRRQQRRKQQQRRQAELQYLIKLQKQVQNDKKQKALKQKIRRREQDICSICYDPNLNLTLSCDHSFHFQCILDIIKHNIKKCPNCRADLFVSKPALLKCQQCSTGHVEFYLNKYVTNVKNFTQKQNQENVFCRICLEIGKRKRRLNVFNL